MASIPSVGATHAPTVYLSCAPLTGWRRALSDSLVVSGATLFGHALGAVTSLLLRGLLDPSLMGVWQGLKLVLSYGNDTNLGVSKAAARELSLATGSGTTQSARQAVNLGFTVNTLTSGTYAIAILVLAGHRLWWGERSTLNDAWAVGLAVVAALAMLQRHVTYQVTLLRAKQQFIATSWLAVQEAVLTLAVSGVAVWCLGVYGLYLATAVVLVGSLIFLRGRNEPLRWAWDWPEIRRLIGIGFPLLLAAVVSSLFLSLDKWMILAYLDDGAFQLGCYSLALMLTGQLYGLASMVATVMGPRYGEMYGRTGSHRDVARLAARSSELLAAALALPAGLVVAIAPPLLGWLLPKYQSGLSPLVWLAPGTVAMALALPANGYLAAVNRGRSMVAALGLSIVVAGVGNHVALRHGNGLGGVAAAMCLADVVYLVFIVAISLWPHLPATERLRYPVCLSLVVLPPLALATWLHEVQCGAPFDVRTVVAAALAVTGVWAAIVFLGWKLGGWQGMWQADRTAIPN